MNLNIHLSTKPYNHSLLPKFTGNGWAVRGGGRVWYRTAAWWWLYVQIDNED